MSYIEESYEDILLYNFVSIYPDLYDKVGWIKNNNLELYDILKVVENRYNMWYKTYNGYKDQVLISLVDDIICWPHYVREDVLLLAQEIKLRLI
jgi:hypothetical protein